MRIILNAVFAYLIVLLLMSLNYELSDYPLAVKLTSWVYRVPMRWQVLGWWILLTWPHLTMKAGGILANGAFRFITTFIDILGNVVTHLVKYRAGQIILGVILIFGLGYFLL